MSELSMRTSDGRTAFAPGEMIELVAAWSFDLDGDGRPDADALEARLFFHTEGKGTKDVRTAWSERVEAPRVTGEHRFETTAPAGPYSFSGSLITLLWSVELVTLPGEKNVAQLDLTIAPGAVEVRLTRAEEQVGNA